MISPGTVEKSEPLALLGGSPVNPVAWPETNTIGEEEKQAALEVLESGILSGFRAGAGSDFLGGSKVRQLEEEWAEYFGCRHAVSFNSLTSGLFAAIGAIGIGRGDEVIVPPLTMSASVVSPLAYGGIPVFADIDPTTLCLDPNSIEERISPRTRAIVVVHLFGHPAEMDRIMEIADRHHLQVIEDCAQAPAARYRGRTVGTIGHIGGFSLNYHKTIHCGEGGVLITNNDELALRLQLIRNHGEVAVEGLGVQRWNNIFGGNYRMTELQAAIASCQLKKLEHLTEWRIRLAAHLDGRLKEIPGLVPQRLTHPESRHVYYVYPMRCDESLCGLPKDLFVRALRAEGIDLRTDYARPVYWEPLFRQRVPPGQCPVAERVYEKELLFGKFCRWPLTEEHMDEAIRAFQKVLRHRSELAVLVDS